jgi:DNA repair protein RadC
MIETTNTITPQAVMEPSTSTYPTPRLRLLEVQQATVAAPNSSVVHGPEDSGQLLCSLIGSKDREHVVVLHLDGAHHMVSAETVSVGTLCQAQVHPREIFKGAFLANARSIIVGHNHPSGNLTPSPEDLRFHRLLIEAGELLQVPVLDFIIVAGRRWWAASETSPAA